jgi:drug/metabolite transporter (DMT)-like permease
LDQIGLYWLYQLDQLACIMVSNTCNQKGSLMSSNTSHLTRGYMVALLSAAILSTTAIFIRHLTQTYQIPALVLAFWRDAFVILSLLPVLGLLRPALLRAGRQHLGYLVIYGLILALFNSLWTLSVTFNGAAVATVLCYSSGGFTALLGGWLLKEHVGWAKVLVIVSTLAGCALVSGAVDAAAWQGNLAGIVTGVSSGLLYAIYSLMGRSAAQRGLNPWTTLFYVFTFAAAFLLIANLIPGGFIPGGAAQAADMFWLGDSWDGWGILFLLAAGPTLLGYGLYNVSLSLLPSSVANLIVTSEPAITAAIAYIFLHEQLTPSQIAGSLLILAGVAFLRIYEGRTMGRDRAMKPGEQELPTTVYLGEGL